MMIDAVLAGATSWTIAKGDCREVLARIKAGSVQCVVTSPPYWGLRDYKLAPSMWGGDLEHEHEWGEEIRNRSMTGGVGTGTVGSHQDTRTHHKTTSAFCSCGAWLGCLGLEPTPDLYLEHLVTIFRELRRVLRDDGMAWLNLGDSYAGGHGPSTTPGLSRSAERDGHERIGSQRWAGLKPKDLVGIPWRAAFALQADGWWLRSALPWLKRSSMPESIEDRPTTAHEYVFLLSVSERYYYDTEAVKIDGSSGPSDRQKMAEGLARIGGKHKSLDDQLNKASVTTNIGARRAVGSSTRQWRTADPWFLSLATILAGGEGLLSDEADAPLALVVNSAPFPGAHFATFPPKLIEPCIKAGTSERGQCPACGAPWVRLVEREPNPSKGTGDGNVRGFPDGWTTNAQSSASLHRNPGGVYSTSRSIGWRPTCSCQTADPVPQLVLDPFAGSGTAGMVARRLLRRFIGIEASPEYVEMARRRIIDDAPLFNAMAVEA